jgi:HSP20 family molecular chaperone IbpA
MPSPLADTRSGSTSVDRAQQYKSGQGCNKDCNTCSGCGNGMKDCNCSGTATRDNNQLANVNQGGQLSGVNDLWSGGNLDQLRLEWAGTDPSSKEYTITSHLPQGLNPSDLSVSVDERTRMLTMKCQTKNHQEQKDEQGSFYMSQDSAAFTQRSFTLPDDVDLLGIKATKNNSGGFQLHLPKNTNSNNNQQLQQQGGVKQITIQ